MNRHFIRRVLLVSCAALMVTGCGSRETKEALQKTGALEAQGQYTDANAVLLDALQKREAKIRDAAGAPTDQKGSDDLTKRVQSDVEILKMEHAQIMLFLAMDRPDLASAVYTDIEAGNPGDPVVFNALKNKDPKLRIGAARILALSGKADAIDPLIAATKDSDQDVRRAAVTALGMIKNPGTVPALIDALKDSYWFVRSEAAVALGQQKDLRAVKPLLGIVTDPDGTVENSAENALLLLCSVPGAPAEEFANRLNDPNPKIWVISAACLAILHDTRATPYLVKLTDAADPEMRLHGVKALGNMQDPSAISTLRKLLKDPDVNVRGWSIIGLARLKDRDSVPELSAIAADEKETSDIRAAAAAAVKHITGEPTATNPPADDGH